MRRFYQVRPQRYLHFPDFPAEHRVWAKPGDYVEATHPMLQTWIGNQLGKVQAVAVVPRGSVLIDESKLPRGVLQMMATHDKGHRGIPVTTEPVYESPEAEAKARAAAGEPAPFSAQAGGSQGPAGATESDASGSTQGAGESVEDAVEAASGAAGEVGGIPDVQPPAEG